MTTHRDQDDRLLLAALAGELDRDRAEELRRRLEREDALARRHEQLTRRWQGLEPPAPSPVPPGFAARVAARARGDEPQGARAGLFAPAWARATGAALLVAGVAAGAVVGVWAAPVLTGGSGPLAEQLTPRSAWEASDVPSLADLYWGGIDDGSDQPAAAADGAPPAEGGAG